MVDAITIQTISAMAAAVGVCLGILYWAVNLRETTRNRRITLTNTIMQPFMTPQGIRQFYDLYTMDWTDLEDYRRKYDSRVNPDNFALRLSMWNLCENCGSLYKAGLIDLQTLYEGTNGLIQDLWIKFEPVIDMYREHDFSRKSYSNFEFVAKQMIELQSRLKDEDALERQKQVIREHSQSQ